MSILKKKGNAGGARDFSMKSRNSLTNGARQRDAVFQRDDAKYTSKRSQRRTATWMELHAKPVGFVLGLIGGWLFSWLVIGVLTRVFITPLIHMFTNTSVIHMFDPIRISIGEHGVNAGIFLYIAGRFWLFIPALVLATLVSVVYGKQAAKTVAKLDDSAMETDVNDAWIWSVGEMIEQYAVIADLGMHTKTVPVSSIVGHIYLKNNGLKKLNMAKHDKTGKIIRDENGEIVREKVPMIDNSNIRKTLDMQGLKELDEKSLLIDATKYPYDEKDGRVRTLADAINEDWYMPDFEFLRPMGAYFVETNSVHTLILSMTRGNKTQLATLATVDAWRRDSTLWNLVTNDPKGGAQCSLVKSWGSK